MIDMNEVDDSIAAVARTLDALAATGIETPVLIGVLSGSLTLHLRRLPPETQTVVCKMLVEKFSAVTQ